MSVVAFKDGFMAGDTQVTDGHGAILGYQPKVMRIDSKKFGKSLLGLCGDMHHMEWLKHWIMQNEFDMTTVKSLENNIYQLPNRTAEDAGALLVTSEEAHRSRNSPDYEPMCLTFSYFKGGPVRIRRKFLAIGSGSHLALGATASGKTALEAVKIASELAPGLCGGSCVELKLG